MNKTCSFSTCHNSLCGMFSSSWMFYFNPSYQDRVRFDTGIHCPEAGSTSEDGLIGVPSLSEQMRQSGRAIFKRLPTQTMNRACVCERERKCRCWGRDLPIWTCIQHLDGSWASQTHCSTPPTTPFLCTADTRMSRQPQLFASWTLLRCVVTASLLHIS